MIYAIKCLYQITENSSNMHFFVNRFEYTICETECSNFVSYPFPKTLLFCDQYVVCMQVLA